MINTLNYSDYTCVDETAPYKNIRDVNITSQDIDEMKHFLFLTTHNHYTKDEVEYIIKNKLLEYE